MRDPVIGSVMTTGVVQAREQMSVMEAARLMRHHRVSGLPVTDAERHVIGMITEVDVFRLVVRATKLRARSLVIDLVLDTSGVPLRSVLQKGRAALDGKSVGEVMQRDPVTVHPNARASEAGAIMASKGFNRLPVVEGGRLVGIVSGKDIEKARGGD